MKKSLFFTAALFFIPPQAYCLSLGDIFTEVVNQAIQGDSSSQNEPPAPVKPQTTTANSDQGEREETEQERDLREKAEKAQLEKLANAPLERMLQQANIPKERLLIWEDSNTRFQLPRGNTNFYANKFILDTVNKYAESEVDEATKFTPPRKSEFEKQADYEVRLKKAQTEFNLSQAVADADGYRFKMIKKYFNPMVGAPRFDYAGKGFKYDAETESLYLVIDNENSSELIRTPVKFSNVSPETAQAFQVLSQRQTDSSSTPCLTTKVGMEWLANRLTAKFVVFRYFPNCQYGGKEYLDAYNLIAALPESHSLKAGSMIDYQYAIIFGKETANNYDKMIAQADQSDQRRFVAEDKTKSWYPLYSKIKDEIYECKVIKDNIAVIGRTVGEKAAYENAVSSRNRYAICFR